MFRSYKTKTDFTALAKMKWINGCSTKLLAQTFEVTEATIEGYLRKLKKDGALQKLKLSKNETVKIYESILGEAQYGKIS